MTKRFKTLVVLAFATLNVSACASVLNATIPETGYSVRHDIAYGDNPRQSMDIYIPDNLQKPTPVILFIYGGAWRMGDKDSYLFLGQAFASRGYVVAVADYRIYPEVTFPAFVEDNAHAFKYVHDHIADYGGDPDNLFIAGHSAGAFNVMMLAADEHYLKQAGANSDQIRGVIGIAGPYDFLPLTDPDIIPVFNNESNNIETQPIHYMNHKLPPVFLATGKDDDQVQARNSVSVANRLDELSSPYEIHLYPDVGHIGIILSLADGFRYKAPLLNDIDQFIQSTMHEQKN